MLPVILLAKGLVYCSKSVVTCDVRRTAAVSVLRWWLVVSDLAAVAVDRQ